MKLSQKLVFMIIGIVLFSSGIGLTFGEVSDQTISNENLNFPGPWFYDIREEILETRNKPKHYKVDLALEINPSFSTTIGTERALLPPPEPPDDNDLGEDISTLFLRYQAWKAAAVILAMIATFLKFSKLPKPTKTANID